MIHQYALHVSAVVSAAQVEPLLTLLGKMGSDPGGNSVLPFSKLEGVHFGRLILVPGTFTSSAEWLPDTLVLTTNFDGSMQRHLQQLADVGGDGFDKLFAHCADYPHSNDRNIESRVAYLQQHSQKVAAHYVNTRGRSLEQLTNESALHCSIQDYLDKIPDSSIRNSVELLSDIREFVGESAELKWALTPAPSDTWDNLLRWVKLVAAALLALVSVIFLINYPFVLLTMILLFIILLRAHEIGNLPENFRPPNSRIATRRSEEEQQTQNQLSSVGFVQAGVFRRILLAACLWLLEFGNRNIFYRGHLAGVDTIHFARWVMCDNNRRVLFFSNYDGSPETYQDDFIERVAFGLNLVFSNGLGWPKSRYLLFAGSNDEQAFRAFYRNHQIRTQVWYAAAPYQGSTAVNISRNEAIRDGLSETLNAQECRQWLQLF